MHSARAPGAMARRQVGRMYRHKLLISSHFFPKNISFVQTSSFYVCLFMVIVILLQDLDEKRIKNIKNFMLSSVDVERKVFPIIMQCLDGMENAANSINEKEVKTDTE